MAPKQEKLISDYYYSDAALKDDPRYIQDQKDLQRFIKFMKLCEIEKPKNWRQHCQTLYNMAVNTLTEYYQDEGRRKTSITLWSRIVACGVYIHHNPRGIEVSELPDEEYMQWEDRRADLNMETWDLVAVEVCVKCSMCEVAKRKCEYACFSDPEDCRCCQLLGLPCSRDYCNVPWRYSKPGGEYPLPQPVSNAAIARLNPKPRRRRRIPVAEPAPKKGKSTTVPAPASVPAPATSAKVKAKAKAKTPKVKAALAPVPAPIITSKPNGIFARKRRPEDFMDPNEIEGYELDAPPPPPPPVIMAKKPSRWFEEIDDREPGPSKRSSSKLDAIHKLITSSGAERSVAFLEKLTRRVLRLPKELQNEVERTYGDFWGAMVALKIYDSAGFTLEEKQDSLDGEGRWPLLENDVLGTMPVRNWDLDPKSLEQSCSACKTYGMPCHYQYHVRIQGKTPSTKCRFCAIGKRKCNAVIVMDEPGCPAQSTSSVECNTESDAPVMVQYATSEDDSQTRVASSPSVVSQELKRKRKRAGVTSSEASEIIVISDDDEPEEKLGKVKGLATKKRHSESVVCKTAAAPPKKKRKVSTN
ncbi:hypothetical protein CYLTODRAFT_492167 [Cylindrobasidium torrendii FP15055 ss-10]|uniref:Uncharacterized protein n=1 Tax=Cylindrobasidium torrendii FP15055 ss-10 TaxID=1314674 RepID=A0A0D7B4V4_9AGAR|nr:hypothetical protein CYLTODRAFT_492167 [Cylindrobasidium torrendii FP15055 ss-10]